MTAARTLTLVGQQHPLPLGGHPRRHHLDGPSGIRLVDGDETPPREINNRRCDVAHDDPANQEKPEQAWA